MDPPIAPNGLKPPEWMQANDSSLADGARKHVQEIQKKRSHRSLLSPINHKDRSKANTQLPTPPSETEPITVDFKDKRKKSEEEGKTDQFKWAVVYENQRGVTVFSTAYYSSRSLLPHDPPPFTVPDTGNCSGPSLQSHHATPNVSLTTYPLPDPTWRWVSRSWFVDMRGDGDVQHDGFEYNWFFRRDHWRAHVGWLSAGGYVRRRRWVRLMMRPSEARLQAEASIEDNQQNVTNEGSAPNAEDIPVWRGDRGDWGRVRKILKGLARDGPRLDLWADWLSDLTSETLRAGKEVTSDDPQRNTSAFQARAEGIPSSQERPHREWIFVVLLEHGKELRSCFVYPDSRAQLRDLLVEAKLARNTESVSRTPGLYLSGSTVAAHNKSVQFLGPSDFWSRSSGLNLVLDPGGPQT